ncbi:hypothetical protein COCOBI_11-0040 [Coccomyxa sp. Obi]|nr:hypothetical protein COCOBI_11-0040 [Coccomyxa sp. Obi]
MGAHGAAITDCSAAFRLAGEESASSVSDLAAIRVAALLQRGLAAEVLERFGHSKRDFLAVLSLDPSNRMASTALARLARSSSAQYLAGHSGTT